ncbi:MAG TPA: hypothetical protein VLF66_12450, partial [Thermoanaerobaculia bacterium]|nr:hypothetical protein [Thermoanaerobaculia bacterium]
MKKRFDDIAFELVIGLCALSLLGVDRSPGVGSWYEECTIEGCNTEELEEIYNSYYSECIDETCSTEEISELSGGPGENDNMLFDFLKHQWVIQSGNISSTRLPDNAAWLFTGASSTGLLYQVWEPVNQSVSNLANVHDVNFTDRVSSFRVGEDAYLATYNDASFSGAQLVVATDQASLGSPFDK